MHTDKFRSRHTAFGLRTDLGTGYRILAKKIVLFVVEVSVNELMGGWIDFLPIYTSTHTLIYLLLGVLCVFFYS